MERLTHIIVENWRRTLWVIFLTSFVVRLGLVLTLQDGFYFPDSGSYSEAAMNLISNGELGKSYNRPPGYPAFLALIYLAFGESVRAIRVVESFIGALIAILLALIGRRISGELAGVLAGVLWSIYPIAIFITGLIYPTNLVTMLLATAFLCLVRENEEQLRSARVFLAGIVAGLAALTIPIVLATVLVISIWLLYSGGTRRFLLAGLLVLGTALVVIPWVVRDYYAYERVVLVEPRTQQHLPRIRTPENTIPDNRIQSVLKNPGKYAARFSKEFIHFWQLYPDRIAMDRPGFREKTHQRDPRVVQKTIFSANKLINFVSILTTGPLFLFALIGTAGMFFRRDYRSHLSLIWVTILSFAMGYSIFVAKMRYRIPVEPYIIILAAHGMIMTACMVARSFAYGLGTPHTRRYDAPKEA